MCRHTHTYIHLYKHTYTHTYVHTYMEILCTVRSEVFTEVIGRVGHLLKSPEYSFWDRVEIFVMVGLMICPGGLSPNFWDRW